jgi:hypothetical protein
MANLPTSITATRTAAQHRADHETIHAHVNGLTTGTFTPVLAAVTTNPTLGTSPGLFGRYVIWPTDHATDDICEIQMGWSFGAGMAIGEGVYLGEVPANLVPSFPMEAAGFSSDDGGEGVAVDADGTGDLSHANLFVAVDSELAALPNVTSGVSGVLVPVLDYDQLDGFSVTNYVTHITPWTWAQGDQLRLSCRFWVNRASSTY